MAFHTHFLAQTTEGYGTAVTHTHTHTLRFISTDSLQATDHIWCETKVFYTTEGLISISISPCLLRTVSTTVRLVYCCTTWSVKYFTWRRWQIAALPFAARGSLVHSTDVALKRSHTVCCTVQVNTLVTQGAALDEVVKTMWRGGRDNRDAALKS